MSCSKTIGYIGAAILFIAAAGFLIFGFLLVLGSGNPAGQASWFGTGLFFFLIAFVLVALGFGAIWLARKRAATAAGDQPVTYKIDLPANVNMDTIKCKSCGGALTAENIQMVAGAPVVTCPYCHTTYQLTEEPKW
jgi:hypothetical protein